MKLYYTVISIINIVAMLILDSMISQNDVISKRAKRFFRLSACAIIVVIAAEIATIYLEYAASYCWLPYIIANIIGFSLTPIIPLLIGCAIGNCNKMSVKLLWIPASVNSALTLLSAKYGFIFSVSPENVYSRGNLFLVFIVAYVSGMVSLFAETLISTKLYQNKNRVILLLMFIFLFFGTSIQVVAPQLHITWLCISFVMSLYYAYYCEQNQRLDVLTSLLNRCAYESYIRRIDGSKNVTIIFFDIDDFKIVNDKYGHPFGDFCLTTVSSCIRGAFSKSGLCYRVGGDEFCVISKQTDKAIIHRAQQDFLDKIDSARKMEKRLPTVSIGYTFYNKAKGSIKDAINIADQQMYQFKQQQKILDPAQYSVASSHTENKG